MADLRIGKVITLQGKTLKGKNKVRENGRAWRIVRIEDNVSCLKNGRGILLRPIKKPRNIRWIKVIDDPDFTISL